MRESTSEIELKNSMLNSDNTIDSSLGKKEKEHCK